MKKRGLILLVCVLLSAVCGICVACKKPTNSEESSSSSEGKFEYTITIYGQDTVALYSMVTWEAVVSLNGEATEDIVTWASSDETIAKIGEDGTIVTMNKEGNVIITATHSSGEKSEKNISVQNNGAIPVLELKGVDEETSSMMLIRGEHASLGAELYFSGAKISDAVFSYSVKMNSNSITLNEQTGEIQANEYGVAIVEVNVEWRGFQKSVSVTVNVCEDLLLYIHGEDVVEEGELQILSLYVSALEFDGYEFKNLSTLTHSSNQSEGNGVIEWHSKDENVAVVAQDGTVTAKTVGETEIYYVYKSEVFDSYQSPSVKVKVNFPVIERTESQLVSFVSERDSASIDFSELFIDNDSVLYMVIGDKTFAPLNNIFDFSSLTSSIYEAYVYVSEGYAIKTNLILTWAITTIDEFKSISGVRNNYYQLQSDLYIEARDEAVLTSLESMLDLNGHTITYNSNRATWVPLIDTVSANGMLYNGKIVAKEVYGVGEVNNYTGTGALLVRNGTGTLKNLDIDVEICGGGTYNKTNLIILSATLSYDTVVIKAKNNSTKVQNQKLYNTCCLGVFQLLWNTEGTAKNAGVFKNVIIIREGILVSRVSTDYYNNTTGAADDLVAFKKITTQTNSGDYISQGAYTTANAIDTTVFVSNGWLVNPATKLPSRGEKISIGSVGELKAISGVSGNWYQLQSNLTIEAGDVAVLASLNSVLDLNGYTITYNSNKQTWVPFINTLSASGAVCNGKIVVNETYGAMYSGTSALVVQQGTGTLYNLEIDVTINGYGTYNNTNLVFFNETLTFDTVVLKATNDYVHATTQENQNNACCIGVFPTQDNIGTFKNVIIIRDNIRLRRIYTGGYYKESETVFADNQATKVNSGDYKSVETYTTANAIDTTVFNSSVWDIDTVTKLPSFKVKQAD